MLVYLKWNSSDIKIHKNWLILSEESYIEVCYILTDGRNMVILRLCRKGTNKLL